MLLCKTLDIEKHTHTHTHTHPHTHTHTHTHTICRFDDVRVMYNHEVQSDIEMMANI